MQMFSDATPFQAVVSERSHVARDTALSIGRTPEQAWRIQVAAEEAAKQATPENPYAGRVSVGKRPDGSLTMAIMGPSGAYFDPLSAPSPANTLAGSE